MSWFSGEVIKGPQVIQRSFALYEMPVFAKAGAVVPMRTGDIGEGWVRCYWGAGGDLR